MTTPSKKIPVLCAVAGLLALTNCATTHESFQECRAAAISFCDKTVGARNPSYPQCLDTQIAACGVR